MKNYRERLKKYQNNEMTDAEATIFEKELQDATALFDYLLEHEELQDFPPTSDSAFKEDKQVKQKIRQRLYRVTAIITIVVLLIIGGSSYLIPKLLDAYYYNPLENQKLDENGDFHKLQPSKMELYQRVYQQVALEQDRFVNTSITKIGPATYEVHQMNFNDFKGNPSINTYVINKGKVASIQAETNVNPSLIYHQQLVLPDYLVDHEKDTSPGTLKSKIEQLPESSWLKLKLPFPKPLTWDNLQQFISEHPEVTFYTATLKGFDNLGVRLDYENNYTDTLSGFNIPKYDSLFIEQLEKDYPQLISPTGTIRPSMTEDDVKSFLISNFTYLLNHPEDNFVQYTAGIFHQKQDYQNALTSLKNDELEFSHIEVALPKSVYSTFVTLDNFHYVTLEDLALFSMYQTE